MTKAMYNEESHDDSSSDESFYTVDDDSNIDIEDNKDDWVPTNEQN